MSHWAPVDKPLPMNSNYLDPTYFIDCKHPDVLEYARTRTEGGTTDTEKTRALFHAVRDGFFYDPYYLDFRREALVASTILKKRTAYCIEKAVLLCAVLRAVEIPARLNFGNVKNHIAVDRLTEILKTNVLVFHGCTEVFLNGKWIKITPAFNKGLCKKLGVPVLDFDGENDAVFQQYSDDGSVFMEYVHDYGSFADMPYDLGFSEIQRHYPHIAIPENRILDLTE